MSRDSVAVLLATWERDVAEAGPLNKKDLRPERFIADLKAALAREAAPQASGGDAGDADALMRVHDGLMAAWEGLGRSRAEGSHAADVYEWAQTVYYAARRRRLATTDSAQGESNDRT